MACRSWCNLALSPCFHSHSVFSSFTEAGPLRDGYRWYRAQCQNGSTIWSSNCVTCQQIHKEDHLQCFSRWKAHEQKKVAREGGARRQRSTKTGHFHLPVRAAQAGASQQREARRPALWQQEAAITSCLQASVAIPSIHCMSPPREGLPRATV